MMAVRLDVGKRYDMPASFGPSMVPEQTEVSRAEALVLTTPTIRSAVERLVPSHFQVPDDPVLTIAHMAYHGVDYLGGRSYNEIVVSVSASFSGADGAVDASLALALWVDQPGALISGREFMGLPKILGRISDLDEAMRFTCAEYEAPVIEGGASDLVAFAPERLAKLNARAEEVRTFGWKYVAAAGGGSDVDQPLINVMRWRYERAWSGRGDFRFMLRSFAEAPMSAAVIKGLATLPLGGAVRAFRGVGRATIDRSATRRLIAA
jgi:hypothetical protein